MTRHVTFGLLRAKAARVSDCRPKCLNAPAFDGVPRDICERSALDTVGRPPGC